MAGTEATEAPPGVAAAAVALVVRDQATGGPVAQVALLMS